MTSVDAAPRAALEHAITTAAAIAGDTTFTQRSGKPNTILMMRPTRWRRTVLFTAMLTLLAALTLVLTTQAAVRYVIDDAVPSDPPALLAPISEDGRVGWSCPAEKAARATTVRDAELPAAAP